MKNNLLFRIESKVCLALILFVLGIQTSSAICLNAKNQETGDQGGYHYELWNPSVDAKQCMTLGSGALFSGTWSNAADYLARRGVYYGTGNGKTYKNRAGIQFNYTVDWQPQYVAGGNSNIGVYGWVHTTGGSTINAEFYIVENWYQYHQGMDTSNGGAIDLGQINVNSVYYEVYKTKRLQQPSPFGTIDFPQYISVRKYDRGNQNQDSTVPGVISGQINVSAHFAAWEKLGLNLSGELYEVAFSAEGYQSSGTVNVSQLDIVTNMPTPTSIALAQSAYTVAVDDAVFLHWVNTPDSYGDGNNVIISTNGTTTCNNVYLSRIKGMWNASGVTPGTCTLTIISPDGLKLGTATITVTSGAAQMRMMSLRALGTKGGEQIFVVRDGHRINQGHVLTTAFQTFTDTVYGEGDIGVEFTTDDGATNGHDVRLDYISVDGIRRETESLAVNPAAFVNGKCGGGGNTEWLNCNGAVNFGALKQDHTITVRARGNAGGEHISVLINGQAVNAGWLLGTSFLEYTVNVIGDGDINIKYDNDGGLKDVVIDWVKVDSQNPRQAEKMQYNTGLFANGRCGGGSYSEWMHCNGVIGFGKISDNFN